MRVDCFSLFLNRKRARGKGLVYETGELGESSSMYCIIKISRSCICTITIMKLFTTVSTTTAAAITNSSYSPRPSYHYHHRRRRHVCFVVVSVAIARYSLASVRH